MPPKKRVVKMQKAAPPEPLGMFWYIMVFFAIGCAVGLFAICGLSNWFVTDPFTIVTYRSGNTPSTFSYKPTEYGLFTVYFNGGQTSEPWYRKSSRVCSAIDSLAPITGVVSLFVNPDCPADCSNHYRIRCQFYNKMSSLGYVAMGSCGIVGLVVIVSVIWLLVFGVSTILLQLVWLGGGLANLCCIGAFVYEFQNQYEKLTSSAMLPSFHYGNALYAAIAVSGVLVLLGLVVTFYAILKDRIQWSQRQNEIDEAIIGAQPPGPFGAPSPFSAGPAAYAPMAGRPPPGGFGGRPPIGQPGGFAHREQLSPGMTGASGRPPMPPGQFGLTPPGFAGKPPSGFPPPQFSPMGMAGPPRPPPASRGRGGW